MTTSPHLQRAAGATLLALAASTVGLSSAWAAEAEQAHQQITHSADRASIPGPGDYFTGRARIDPMAPANENINASAAYVTFEPGTRSAWHTHPKGQFLLVTAGDGLTQEWGKPIQHLHVGDVVWCPPGVKHWHGAAPTTAMTHIALTGTTEDGKNVTWMEKVTDEQYKGE